MSFFKSNRLQNPSYKHSNVCTISSMIRGYSLMINIIDYHMGHRLIHGQVAISWIPHTKNLVLIANDNIYVTPTLQ